MTMRDSFLFSCEHGGNKIPAPYRALFRDSQALLATHRGYDFGALLLAKTLADAFHAPLLSSTVSRLLVDLNRSPGHPRLFSDATRSAPAAVREEILAKYYRPYRTQVAYLVGQAVSDGGRVIHIASHSFTPELGGKVRNADVGLLYDPGRPAERALCLRWQAALARLSPNWRVRRNSPYVGNSDGLARDLRSRLSPQAYLGVELEVNQRIVLANGASWLGLRGLLADSLRASWGSGGHPAGAGAQDFPATKGTP